MSGIFKSPNQCDLPGDNLIKFLVSVFFFIDDQIQCYCYVICHTVNVHNYDGINNFLYWKHTFVQYKSLYS